MYSTCTLMIPGADVLVQEHGLVGYSAKMVILVTRGKIPLFLSKIVIDTSCYIVYNLIYRYDKQESLY